MGFRCSGSNQILLQLQEWTTAAVDNPVVFLGLKKEEEEKDGKVEQKRSTEFLPLYFQAGHLRLGNSVI